MSPRAPFAVAVFASGGGTNFQALLDHQAEQDLWRVALLVMNREGGAAERARNAGVPVRVIPTKDRSDDDVAAETLVALDEHGVDIVLLAGYLRRIPARLVDRYRGRMLNIHPALLPDFGGPGMYGSKVHQAVVASHATVSGATVHFVDHEYDDGAVLGQWQVEVRAGDTPDALAARVLRVEHRLYPAAVDHLCRALLDRRTPERMNDVRVDEPPDTVPARPVTAPDDPQAMTNANSNEDLG